MLSFSFPPSSCLVSLSLSVCLTIMSDNGKAIVDEYSTTELGQSKDINLNDNVAAK